MDVFSIFRTWRGRAIVAFLMLQLVLPLHYYVANRDQHDERFAWRMFSPMRMTKCRAAWTKDGAAIPMMNEFHEAWNELVDRGRFRVIEAMGAELCTRYPRAEIRVTLQCEYLDQPGKPRTQSYGGFDLCKVPEL